MNDENLEKLSIETMLLMFIDNVIFVKILTNNNLLICMIISLLMVLSYAFIMYFVGWWNNA